MSDKLTNYIPISRKLFDHPFFTEPRTFSKFEAWLDLLQEARYDPKDCSRMIKNKVITFSRGEIPASLRFLAERWNWSKNKVDSFIELLENEGMITKRTAKGTSQTIITVCKYEDYNSLQKSAGQQKGHDRDSTGTAQGQNSNIVNKENNVDEGRPPAPPPDLPDLLGFYSAKSLLECKAAYFDTQRFGQSIDLLLMNPSVEAQTVDQLKDLATAFNAHCAIKGKNERTVMDWVDHFTNWLKDPKRRKPSSNEQKPETALERRQRLLRQQGKAS